MVKHIIVIKPKARKSKLKAPRNQPKLKVKAKTISEKIATALVKELKKSKLFTPPIAP